MKEKRSNVLVYILLNNKAYWKLNDDLKLWYIICTQQFQFEKQNWIKNIIYLFQQFGNSQRSPWQWLQRFGISGRKLSRHFDGVQSSGGTRHGAKIRRSGPNHRFLCFQENGLQPWYDDECTLFFQVLNVVRQTWLLRANLVRYNKLGYKKMVIKLPVIANLFFSTFFSPNFIFTT